MKIRIFEFLFGKPKVICHGTNARCLVSDALVNHALNTSTKINDTAKKTIEELNKLETIKVGQHIW